MEALDSHYIFFTKNRQFCKENDIDQEVKSFQSNFTYMYWSRLSGSNASNVLQRQRCFCGMLVDTVY